MNEYEISRLAQVEALLDDAKRQTNDLLATLKDLYKTTEGLVDQVDFLSEAEVQALEKARKALGET